MPLPKDIVEVELDGRQVIRLSDYQIRLGIFRQPSSFSCTIGRPYQFRRLAEYFPPKTPFRVLLNGRQIQMGLTDSIARTGGDETQIQIRGRGILAKLIDSEVDEDASFSESTYYKLTLAALDASGMEQVLVRLGIEQELVASNEANRKAITGSKTVSALSPETVEAIETEAGQLETGETKRVYNTIRAKVGTRWWTFLTQQYRRIGLFLWEGADGKLILSYPNAEQKAIGGMFRNSQQWNILDDSFANDTTSRHSECVIYAKQAKQAKSGVKKVLGRYIDDEMVALLNPEAENREDGGAIRIVKTIRDAKVKNPEHAANLARREIAEERRAGWNLSYTFQDHCLIEPETNLRVFPGPDTVINVDDDELGLYGQLYVEAVTLMGRRDTTLTTIDVLRPEDVFFRGEVEEKKRKLRNSGANTVEAKVFTAGIFGTLDEALQEPVGIRDPNTPFGSVDPMDVIDALGATSFADESLVVTEKSGKQLTTRRDEFPPPEESPSDASPVRSRRARANR